MSFDDRTKEIVRYRIERLRIFAIVALATAGGVLNLLLGEIAGLRLFLAVVGIVFLAVLIELLMLTDFVVNESANKTRGMEAQKYSTLCSDEKHRGGEAPAIPWPQAYLRAV